jgi:bifunctional DNase/RNase
MELRRIIISEVHDQQVIVLREVDGERSFPIVIGIFEATSIDRRVKNMPSPRPLTHDLVTNVIEQLGGDIQDVIISELKEHTYFAKLRIRHEGELIEIDSRPSDAIALAASQEIAGDFVLATRIAYRVGARLSVRCARDQEIVPARRCFRAC